MQFLFQPQQYDFYYYFSRPIAKAQKTELRFTILGYSGVQVPFLVWLANENVACNDLAFII